MDVFLQLLESYTFQTIAMGAMILGLISGVIGSFAVLRQQGLLGDGISHSTLPGIVFVFLLMQVKHNSMLLLGAALSGLLANLLIQGIIKTTRIKFDAALAIVFSVFFGLGMVGLTYVQKMPNSSQAGLDSFIFGQAATMLREDLDFMLVCAGLTLAFSAMLWKEFKLFIFDAQYTETLGFSSKKINIVLSIMLVLGITVGLKTVGSILMCSMLIGPAVAARQWTNKMGRMVILSSIFATISGLVGAAISALVPKMPTGPVIVVVISMLVFASVLFAPQRGLIAILLQRRHNRRHYHRKEYDYVVRS